MISAFCILISHLFLSACGARMPPPHPAQFNARADVLFGGKELAALITQEGPGTLVTEFTAPEELRGIYLRIQGDSASLRYGDMRAELPLEALPASGIAPLLCRVLLRLAQPDPAGFTKIRGGWELKGTADGLNYRAILAADGTLAQVKVPSAGLEVTLINEK